MMRRLSLIAIVLALATAPGHAHDVVWEENTDGKTPLNQLVLRFVGEEKNVLIRPVINETCVVVVTLDPLINPSLISATIDPTIASLTVAVKIKALRESLVLLFEDTRVTGEWHATGQPDPRECTATSPNRFTVPVRILIPRTFSMQPNAVAIGDPISTSTGEVTADSTDLSLGGPLPLSFSRHYGSLLSTAVSGSALGTNWMHNFDQKLSISGASATLFLYPGKIVRFQQSGGSWQLASTEKYHYQLVSSGATYQFLDLPNGLIYTFSAAGALTGIRDRNSNNLTVTPGAAGPLSVSDGLGRTLTFTYAGNTLSSVRDQTGRSIAFTRTGSDLTAASDASGRTWRYNYALTAPGGLLVSALQPMGNTPWTQNYDSSGRVLRQTDSGGNGTSIAFDQPSSGSRQVTDPLGRVTGHTYAAGNLTQLTDAGGNAALFTYDARNRLTSSTNRLGDKTIVAYHEASGYPASVTDAEGNTTSYTYTAQQQGSFTFYNLTRTTLPDGASIGLGYDNSGNILTSTDRAGKVSSYTYNSRGQLLTATNPAGGVMTATYNNDGTVATVRSPSGAVTALVYDALKRVAQLRFADNTSRQFAYDALDRLTSSIDERGKVTRIAYDGNGNVTSVTDALNQTTATAYDTDDLVGAVTDPLGKTSKLQYDALGSLLSVTDASGQAVSYSYDALNRLKSVADPSGKGTSYNYDAEGRLVSVTNALSATTTFEHDKLGRTIRATTPLGETSSRTFDTMGRVTSVSNPLSQAAQFAYDARGLATGVSGPEGISASYTYDDLGLLSGVTDPNGNAWLMKNDGSGRLISKTDPLGRIVSYTYDARNRLSGSANPLGTLQVSYDAAGNASELRYSDGTVKSFTYTDNGDVSSGQGVALAYDAAGRVIFSNGLTITRDVVGRVASITYAPGKTVTYSYDGRGLLGQVSDWAGGSIAFAYDDAARLVSLSRSNSLITQFRYDDNNRVVAINESSGEQSLASITLQRDAAGKVTSAERNLPLGPAPAPGTLGSSYDAAHQLSGASYDELGRLTQDGLRSYTWNLASELKAYSGADGSASFEYDAFGIRISQTAPETGKQDYVLNYALGLPSIATVQSGGTDQRYYVYMPGGALLYAIEAGDNSHRYFHFDEIGSTSFLTDDSGAVTDRYGVTPYGDTITRSGGAVNPFIWLGQWGVMQEGSTGLYYMRRRYYDSATARFISRDPLPQITPTSVNPYQYAEANPVSSVDPTGMKGGASEGLWWTFYPGALANAFGGYLQSSATYNQALAGATTLGFQLWARQAFQLGMTTGYITPQAQGLYGPTDYFIKFFDPVLKNQHAQGIIKTIQASPQGVQAAQDVSKYTAKASYLSKYAGYLKGAGTVLTIVSGAVQGTAAVVEDVQNNAGVVITASDALGYAGTTTAFVMAPQLAPLDLVTGGGISGGIHNAIEAQYVIPKVVFGSVNSQEATAIKSSMSKVWATKGAWNAGEYYANTPVGEAVTDYLAKFF